MSLRIDCCCNLYTGLLLCNKGCKVNSERTSILVRESGTEPVVRVMVEAPDHDTCQKYVDEVVNVICEKGYKACEQSYP